MNSSSSESKDRAARGGRRRPYRPPRVHSERTFEQTTLGCGKTSVDTLIGACKAHKSS